MIRETRFGLCLVLILVLAAAFSSPVFAQDAKDKPATPPAPAAPAPAAPAPTTPPVAAAPAAPMVESIKILFDDKAKNDGELLFTFTPAGGAAKQVRVTVANKMDRKDVAKSAETELKVALGDGYKVDRYDPDKIKIEGKKDAKFSLTISSLTANGLSVRLK
jgi:hypothetical protein